MVLPVTLQISADADGSSWTDLSGAVKRESIRMGGQAGPSGQAGSAFGFDFEDPAAAFELPARRRVQLLVDSVLVAQGRVTDKAIARRSPPVGDVRGFDVNLSDGNAHLQGIPVHGWIRPAESDVARITALCNAFLSGSPRPSTDLAQTYLSSSNPISLPAKTYDATNPSGVVADICSFTRKLFFVTGDDEVFYDSEESTAYSGTLVVTDVDPDVSADEYAPIWTGAAATQDGTELYTGLTLVYGEPAASLAAVDATAETDHDYWREVIYGEATTGAEATSELTAILDERKVEEIRIQFAILVNDDKLDVIKYGQTFSFRAAAAGLLSPVTVRVSRLAWSIGGFQDDKNVWRADIEAGFPKKLAPRLSRGSNPETPAGSTYTPPVVDDWQSFWQQPDPITFSLGFFQRLDQASPSIMTPTAFEVALDDILPSGGDNYRNDLALFISLQYNFAGVLHFRGKLQTPTSATPTPPVIRIRHGLWPDQADLTYDRDPVLKIGTGGVFDPDLGVPPPPPPPENNGVRATTIGTVTLAVGAMTGSGPYDWAVTGALNVTGRQFVIEYDEPRGTGSHLYIHVVDVNDDPTFYPPTSGLQVAMYYLATSDGTTASYTVAPYKPGSLKLLVGGLEWTDGYTETDPAAGAFTFTQVPSINNVIRVSYVAV